MFPVQTCDMYLLLVYPQDTCNMYLGFMFLWHTCYMFLMCVSSENIQGVASGYMKK